MIGRASVIKGLIDAEPIRAGGLSGLLERVCFAVVPVLSASGAGISMMTADGTRGVCIASDPVSQHVDDLQFVLGEGPCMEAFEHRRPVLVTDVADTATRWPLYAPAAEQGGVRAVFAFPLQIGGARLGVLDVFRRDAGPLTADQLTDALLFTDVTVSAVLDRQESAGTGQSDDLDAAIRHRAELFQAQGMIMVQLGVPLAEAMVRLRAHAYAQNRRLDELARDVVAGRIRFIPEAP
jgi:GAF domain-containing protein